MKNQSLAVVSGRDVRSDLVRTWLLKRLLRKRPNKSSFRHFFVDPTDHIGERVSARGFYDSYRLQALQSLIERRRDVFRPNEKQSVCLDIGANIGNHSVFLSSVFDRVISFEPISFLAQVARSNMMVNSIMNVDVRNYGLSSADGKATITVEPGNYGGSSLHNTDKHTAGLKLEIDIVRGDGVLLGEIPDSAAVTFIKIDVEGHEEHALAGIHDLIEKHRPVIWFEAHSREAADRVISVIGKDTYRHLYFFGDPVELKGETAAGAIGRAWNGMRIDLAPVSQFPAGKYLNLIASPVDLLSA
jgi:FkbM family methyltransferase